MRRESERVFELGDFWLSQDRKSPGTWCITWYDEVKRQTRRRSTGLRDLEQAKLKLADFVVQHTKLEQERPDDVLISVILERYYEQHAKHLASQETAKSAIDKWLEYWKGKTVAEMTLQNQEAFLQWIRERPVERGSRAEQLAESTIARQVNVGRSAFAWSYRRHELRSVPYLVRLGDDDARRERTLELAEAAALFNAAASTEHHWRFLLLAFGTAARPGALLELSPRPPMLDLEHHRINLLPPGRKQNKKRRPILPICATLLPWLRLWTRPEALTYRSRRRRVIQLERLITYQGKPLQRMRESFDLLKTRAEISDPDVTAIAIRHTMSTWFAERNVPEREHEIWLGHRMPGSKTTARYVHLKPDYLKSAAAAVDAYFEELAPLVKARPIRTIAIVSKGEA